MSVLVTSHEAESIKDDRLWPVVDVSPLRNRLNTGFHDRGGEEAAVIFLRLLLDHNQDDQALHRK